jgi:hypothetical protein
VAKHRTTVSIDEELHGILVRLVEDGVIESVSSFVQDAVLDFVAALDLYQFVTDEYEAAGHEPLPPYQFGGVRIVRRTTTTPGSPPGLVIDAGGLIAFERGNQVVADLIRHSGRLHISTGVLAQVWRGGGSVAMLARLISRPAVLLHPIDVDAAKAIGQLCADFGHDDVIDVHVALLTRRFQTAVLTSDPGDMANLGVPEAVIIAI